MQLFAMKIGEIEPVQTQFATIIRVLGHEDRPVSESAFQQLKDDAFSTWLEGTRAAAKIKIYAYWKNLDFTPSASTAQ
jgi:hypothetical protein